MDVAYTNSNTSEILYRRKIEVGIGCACVQAQTKRIEHFKQMLVEKKNLHPLAKIDENIHTVL